MTCFPVISMDSNCFSGCKALGVSSKTSAEVVEAVRKLDGSCLGAETAWKPTAGRREGQRVEPGHLHAKEPALQSDWDRI